MARNKIVVVALGDGGVEHYRLLSPYGRFTEYDYDVIITSHLQSDQTAADGTKYSSDELIQGAKAVIFNRIINPFGDHKSTADRIHKTGGKVIVDIDDYWILPPDHILNYQWKQSNMAAHIIESLRLADIVTTTHSYLAEKVNQYNKNIVIVPNAIDTRFKMFEPKPTESEFIRVGWVGGVCHLPDVALLSGSMSKVWDDDVIRKKIQLVLCGYTKDNREVVYKDNTGKERTRKLNPFEHTYNIYESILTDTYKYLSNTYTRQLMTDMPTDDSKQHYRRLNGRPIDEFATFYNEFDIALAPLKDNDFNRCKSELKLIEAGWMGKAVLCSDIHPYTQIAKNNINCLTVAAKRNHVDWYKAIKKLSTQSNFRLDLQQELQQLIQKNYNLDEVNVIRRQLIESL